MGGPLHDPVAPYTVLDSAVRMYRRASCRATGLDLDTLKIGDFEDFVKHRDLPTNPIEWLRNEADLRRMLLGPSLGPET